MFPHGRISRRSVLRLAALGAVGGLIAACGSSSDSTTEAESTSAAGSSSTTTGTTTGTTTASPAAGSGSSTTTSSSSGKTDLTLTLPAEPGFLNPVMVSGDRNFSKISWQLYDSLLVYDFETKQLQPQLATKWEMKDETTWEFTLREGVQFHQGYGELTADDVEFMVNLVVSQNKPLKFL
jgi:peptide/nickel transport system substrate-binding protein